MTLARPAITVAALLAAASVCAQSPPSSVPPPPPIPPATYQPAVTPPAPPDVAGDTELEPQVTIIRRDEDVVEEVRVRGELRYVKVTPRFGRPYFLVPNQSGTGFLRRNSLDIQLSVPMWELFSW